jgi:hypothetical protein
MAADLLIIVPTRGRPQNAQALYESWEDTTAGHADLLFVADDDDPQLGAYQSQINEMPEATLLVGPRLRMVGSLNRAATQYAQRYPFLGFFGDDHRPRTKGWDRIFCDTLRQFHVGVVYGNDLIQGETMPTAVAMTSNIVSTLGYMAPPSMVHLCVDLVWKDWGVQLGRIKYFDDVIIEHLHYSRGKSTKDAVYEDANSADRVSTDSAAYYKYRDEGGLDVDVTKLKTLL